MGVSDKVVEKTAARVQATFVGEAATVEYAIMGFGRHPLVLAGGLLGALFGKPRFLVVTDKATHLIGGKAKLENITPDDVLGTYPRSVDLGSFTGMFPKLAFDDGQVVYVPKPYDKPLRALFEQ